ncbi:MAG TPA: hypothetical protein VFA74_14540 [Terriglobales bacterium]|nr:hypothetical protein [Terriglobales bacterium]
MKRIFVRTLFVVVLTLGFGYIGDYAVIQLRIWRSWSAFEQVTVQPYYAIHEKNGKTEYDSAPVEIDMCIHAIFPHLGYNPCWYANRHKEKRIDI